MKLSTGKVTLVDEKQIWRRLLRGHYAEDIIALRSEALAISEAEPLLQCVMRAGQVVSPQPTLVAARQRHVVEMERLPEHHRHLQGGAVYPVRLSEALATSQQQVETALQHMHDMTS